MPTVFSLFAFHDEAGEEEPACGLHLYFLAKKLAGVPLFTGVALSRSDYTSHDEEVEVKITKRKELRADLDALVDKGREYMCFFHSGTCPLSFIFVERILWDDYHYPGGMRLMYLNLGFSDIEDAAGQPTPTIFRALPKTHRFPYTLKTAPVGGEDSALAHDAQEAG